MCFDPNVSLGIRNADTNLVSPCVHGAAPQPSHFFGLLIVFPFGPSNSNTWLRWRRVQSMSTPPVAASKCYALNCSYGLTSFAKRLSRRGLTVARPQSSTLVSLPTPDATSPTQIVHLSSRRCRREPSRYNSKKFRRRAC